MVHAVRTGWLWLFGCIAVGLGVAAALLWTATPLYASSTRLFVAPSAPIDAASAYQGTLFSQERVISYAELLAGKQLAGRVVDELGLDLTPAEVAQKVTAAPVPDTVILEVTVTDTSPRRARDIATSLGRQFADWVTALESPADGSAPVAASAVKVTTVQAAELDSDPISPDPVRYLSVGAALGLLVGIGLVLARNRLDDTVRSAAMVRELTGVGLIGKVPQDRLLAKSHVVTGLDLNSKTTEAFRELRTNLLLLDVEAPPRVLVVSGAVAGDGTSTVAINLAVVLAQSGSRVLLLDAHLRRPQIATRLGVNGQRGLTDVLSGEASLDDAIQPWGEQELDVLTAGRCPRQPSEAVASAAMRSLVRDLRGRHDHVVIDAPAVLAVSDATVLGALADGCLLVCRYGQTHGGQLAEAAAMWSVVGVPLLGVVLTNIPPKVNVMREWGRYGRPPEPSGWPSAAALRRGNGHVPRHRSREVVESLGPTPYPPQ
jgi:receptor protein-tyrosine kinase